MLSEDQDQQTGTMAVLERQKIDVRALEIFMEENIENFQKPIEVNLILLIKLLHLIKLMF